MSEETLAPIASAAAPPAASAAVQAAALRAALPDLVWEALRDRGLVTGARAATRVPHGEDPPPMPVRGEPLSQTIIRERR